MHCRLPATKAPTWASSPQSVAWRRTGSSTSITRTAYYDTGQTTDIPLNYEVRLYEGLTEFDVIYGTVSTTTGGSTINVGVQKNAAGFTQVGCDTSGGTAPPVAAGQLYHYTLGGACGTPTPSPTYAYSFGDR